jgi:hypothetical protein
MVLGFRCLNRLLLLPKQDINTSQRVPNLDFVSVHFGIYGRHFFDIDICKTNAMPHRVRFSKGLKYEPSFKN